MRHRGIQDNYRNRRRGVYEATYREGADIHGASAAEQAGKERRDAVDDVNPEERRKVCGKKRSRRRDSGHGSREVATDAAAVRRSGGRVTRKGCSVTVQGGVLAGSVGRVRRAVKKPILGRAETSLSCQTVCGVDQKIHCPGGTGGVRRRLRRLLVEPHVAEVDRKSDRAHQEDAQGEQNK